MEIKLVSKFAHFRLFIKVKINLFKLEIVWSILSQLNQVDDDDGGGGGYLSFF